MRVLQVLVAVFFMVGGVVYGGKKKGGHQEGSIERVNEYLSSAWSCRDAFAQSDYVRDRGALRFEDLAQFAGTDYVIRNKEGLFFRVVRTWVDGDSRKAEVVRVWGRYPSRGTTNVSDMNEDGYFLVGSPAQYERAVWDLHGRYSGIKNSQHRALGALFTVSMLHARTPLRRKAAMKWTAINQHELGLFEKLNLDIEFLRNFIGAEKFKEVESDKKKTYARLIHALATSLVTGPTTEDTYSLTGSLWQAILSTLGENLLKSGLIRNFSYVHRNSSWPTLGWGLDQSITALQGKVDYVPPDCDHLACVELWKNSGEWIEPPQLPDTIERVGPVRTFHAPLDDTEGEALDQILAWEKDYSEDLAHRIAQETYPKIASHLSAIGDAHDSDKILVTYLPPIVGEADLGLALAKKIAEEKEWKLAPFFKLNEETPAIYDGARVGTWQCLVRNSNGYATQRVANVRNRVVVLVGGAYREGVGLEWARSNLFIAM